ncbi:hypothetical protein [Spirosoma sp. 209]|uniref:hypothetical protein n=1 Tax=Spirosoma sp. 209 TaxID=1955701 RepID=UPI001117A87D|nr:hypothetical protein [Spirosoma sp. 209]
MKATTPNPVADAFTAYQDKIGIAFKPDQRFYDRVGINRKRFGQVFRGEKPLMSYEVKALSEFLGVPVEDLI